MVDVLLGTDPPCRSTSTWESECPSRPTVSLDHTDIRLNPTVFDMIDQRYGPHSVDLFATRDNRLLDRFVSWRLDPLTIAADAFMFLLKGENPYCPLPLPPSLAFIGFSERYFGNR